MPLTNGETFAGYKIVQLLGSGGMGEVYLAQHPRLPRQDALKVLRPDLSSNASFRDRFIREADLAAGLRHRHIVGVHDRGEYDGQLWIAMDYIDGIDAARLLDTKYPAGMPTDLVVRIITAVASALDYAHKKGLLHRDVKPANIIAAELDGEEPEVYLADFGIARPLDDTSGITTTNMTVGTVAYSAPEQLMGEPLDGRADVYALAATCYHLLTGTQLFTNTNPAVVISRHLSATPPKVSDRRADCAFLDSVIEIALAKEPENRFSSCLMFARTLLDESQGHGTASASASTQAAPRLLKYTPFSAARSSAEQTATGSRHLWVALGSVAAILLLIGVLALTRRPHDSRESNTASATSPMATTSALPTPAPTAGPPVVLPTAMVTTPSPAAPSSTLTEEPDAASIAQAREASYLRTFRGAVDAGRLSWSVLPNSGHSTDSQMVAFGYEACAVMDRYPNSLAQAASVLYQNHGFNDAQTTPAYVRFMSVATALCPDHAQER